MAVDETGRAAQHDAARRTPQTDSGDAISATPSATAPVFSPGPGARGRILATAMRLFYHEGIRAVGIDRLIAESSVTKATFYKHFGSKDALILTYMESMHDDAVAVVNSLQDSASTPAATLHGLVDDIQRETARDDFRGCPFINAASEYPDASHPVRVIVTAHRDWLAAYVSEQFRLAGHPLPGDAADEFVMLRDGAMVGAYIGDRIATTAALDRLARRSLSAV